ncbi:hypothetical protein [Candidatus Chlorohelix sp.]|uniref:hypothetical protein n=1 Tax=Candidatus Chlorohelix sp. TaxID=3139201 RepID=UPI003039D70E
MRWKRLFKAYVHGFLAGFPLGAAYLCYVYWRAGLFPANRAQLKFYKRVRGLED